MRLLPADAEHPSDWEDGLWVEKPGFPRFDCSWVHPPPKNYAIPEFEFEEGHDKNKNEPPPVFYIGSANDCHIRLDATWPKQLCRVFKEGKLWFLEALLPESEVHHSQVRLGVGERVSLRHNDMFSLAGPPSPFSYRIQINEEDNWYLDSRCERDYPNKYPGRFPHRSSLPEAPPAPEELKRLAWQTDQMRRRSEEDQVRVSDWSAFSQYVKRHYYKHGITCTPWAGVGRNRPVDPTPKAFPPRQYPDWICQLLVKERQLAGIDSTRVLPFAGSLKLSGLDVQPQPSVQLDTIKIHDAQDLLDTPTNAVVDTASLLQVELPPVNQHLQQTFRDWLESLDDTLFLLQYHDNIVANFDSLEQVHDIYFKRGQLTQSFFDDLGIKKLGHRRIFEKWFRDFCTQT